MQHHLKGSAALIAGKLCEDENDKNPSLNDFSEITFSSDQISCLTDSAIG